MAEARPGSWLGDAVEEFKKLPPWGKIAIGVLVVAVAAYAIYKGKQKATTSATTASTTGTRAGIPSGAIAPTNGQILPPLSGSTTPTPTPTTTNIMASIRAAFSSPQTGTYDTNNPGGIPVHSTPGGEVTGVLPFGSTEQITGPAVSGPNNFGPNNPSGSTIWYDTPVGYISGYDVTALSTQQAAPQTGQGNGGPSYPFETYTLQMGDNLNEVARKMGLSKWQDLMGSNPGPLQAGQKITVPR